MVVRQRITLTDFEKRGKAALFIGVAAVALKPIYAILFTVLYLLATEVTLTAMVCSRTRAVRTLGTFTMVIASNFLGNAVFPLNVYPWAVHPWAVFLPSVVFAVLALVECTHLLVRFRWYGGQWRPGTDLMIARVVKEGRMGNHNISWLVFANEELSDEHFRTIKNRFCRDCPGPRFDHRCGPQLRVDICLRAVQFFSSPDVCLMCRVSSWCRPGRYQPVEFDFPTSLLRWIDSLLSDFFLTACLLVLPFVAVLADDIPDDWWGKEPSALILLQIFYTIPTFLFGRMVESSLDELMRAVLDCVASLSTFICHWTRAAHACVKGAYKPGVRRTKTIVKSTLSAVARTCKAAQPFARAMKCVLSSALQASESGMHGLKLLASWTCKVAMAVRLAIVTFWSQPTLGLRWMAAKGVTVICWIFEMLALVIGFSCLGLLGFAVIWLVWELVKLVPSIVLHCGTAMMGIVRHMAPVVLAIVARVANQAAKMVVAGAAAASVLVLKVFAVVRIVSVCLWELVKLVASTVLYCGTAMIGAVRHVAPVVLAIAARVANQASRTVVAGATAASVLVMQMIAVVRTASLSLWELACLVASAVLSCGTVLIGAVRHMAPVVRASVARGISQVAATAAAGAATAFVVVLQMFAVAISASRWLAVAGVVSFVLAFPARELVLAVKEAGNDFISLLASAFRQSANRNAQEARLRDAGLRCPLDLLLHSHDVKTNNGTASQLAAANWEYFFPPNALRRSERVVAQLAK